MLFRNTITGFLGFLMLVSAAPAQADDWVEYKSENVLLYSNADKELAQGLVEDLEVFRGYLIRITNVDADLIASKKSEGTNIPFLVFGPKNRVSFKSLTGTELFSLSFFHPRGYVTFVDFGLHPDPFEGKRGKPGREMLFYEYAKYFLKQYSNFNYPLWYIHGFAMYLSTFEEKDGVAQIGLAPLRTVGILGSALSHHLTPIDYILESTREFSTSITGMGNETDFTFSGQVGNVGFENNAFTTDHNHSGILNAETQRRLFKYQSWGIVHYLQTKPELRQKLVEYLVRLAGGEGFKESFEEVFKMKTGDFHQIVYDYTERKLFPSLEVEFDKALASPTISSRELKSDESVFIQNWAKSYFLGQSKRLFAIKNQLDRVSSAFALEARTIVAEMEFFTGNSEKARSLVANILVGNPDYGRANGLLGAILAEQGLVDEARKYLRKAVSQNQNDLIGLYYLGRTYLEGESPNVAEGASAMSRYFSIFPQMERARLELAILDAKTDNIAYSLAELANLASWGSNEAIRAQAQVCLKMVRETLSCDLKEIPVRN